MRINQLRVMKIYHNTLSEMNYLFGQLAISLGDGIYLFCDSNAYCVFDYQKVINYKSVPIEGRSGTGVALIHNIDSIIEDAKAFKQQSLELGNVPE